MNRSPEPQGLLRILGLVFGLSVVVGGMVGSGIMRAPGVVALGISSPTLMLLAWAAGGLVAMISAMPLVEAGASVPRAGGPYPIALAAFGPTTAFLTGWIGWLQYVASSAFIAVVFGEYVERLGLSGGLSHSVWAVGLLLTMGALNLTGTRLSGDSQSLASAAKGAAFLVLVVILFASPRAPVPPSAHPAATGAIAGIVGLGAFVMAIRVIYQTYAGWDAAIYFSEEVHTPERNVARSTFFGIAAVTVLYVAVNAAVLHVLSPAAIAGSALAVGDAAKVSLGATGDKVITALGLLSLAAIVNLQTMAAPRILFRMGREGALPTGFGKVAAGGAPRLAVAATAIASTLFAATGSYESIVRVYSPWTMASIFMVCISAIQLRRTQPDRPRPWKMPLYPWVAILGALIQAALVAVVILDDPTAGAWSVVVAFAPLPVYLILARRWRNQALAAYPEEG
jgi:APA family basic amino acid/polyamine antiporter